MSSAPDGTLEQQGELRHRHAPADDPAAASVSAKGDVSTAGSEPAAEDLLKPKKTYGRTPDGTGMLLYVLRIPPTSRDYPKWRGIAQV
jgi:hypothetical protein